MTTELEKNSRHDTENKHSDKTGHEESYRADEVDVNLKASPSSADVETISEKSHHIDPDSPDEEPPSGVTATIPSQATVAAASGTYSWGRNLPLILSVVAIVIACFSLFYVLSLGPNNGLRKISANAGLANTAIGAEQSSPDMATLLSLVQYLSSATRKSEPFGTELAVAYQMVGTHPEIDKVLDEILSGAETGVPSIEDITTSYADTISEIHGYGPKQLLDQATSSIGSIVGITTQTQQRKAISEEMTVLVAAGKLTEALRALDKFDGQYKQVFFDWRSDVEQRLKLDAAVSEIRRITFLSILNRSS